MHAAIAGCAYSRRQPRYPFEEAAFTTLGAVALHGIRTAEVKLGDSVAVIGLGLLGQLTVQLLKAAGCRVLGMDIASGSRRSGTPDWRRCGHATASAFRELCLAADPGRRC